MKIDIALRSNRALTERVTPRKSQTTQRHGNQRRRGPLAASEEKVAPPTIGRIKVAREKIGRVRLDRMPRLLRPPQSNDLGTFTCRTEI